MSLVSDNKPSRPLASDRGCKEQFYNPWLLEVLLDEIHTYMELFRAVSGSKLTS
jgi:hypothetical protein